MYWGFCVSFFHNDLIEQSQWPVTAFNFKFLGYSKTIIQNICFYYTTSIVKVVNITRWATAGFWGRWAKRIPTLYSTFVSSGGRFPPGPPNILGLTLFWTALVSFLSTWKQRSSNVARNYQEPWNKWKLDTTSS